jgi:hypothetical protein
MARQGIVVHTTNESDPVQAVTLLAAGSPLPAALPHDHDHAHGHDHAGRHDRIQVKVTI